MQFNGESKNCGYLDLLGDALDVHCVEYRRRRRSCTEDVERLLFLTTTDGRKNRIKVYCEDVKKDAKEVEGDFR